MTDAATPDDPTAPLLRRAWSHLDDGRLAPARELLDAAAALRPDAVDVAQLRAHLDAREGRLDEAVAALAARSRAAPDEESFDRIAASLLAAHGRLDAAEALYAARPTPPMLAAHAVIVARSRRDPERALDLCARARAQALDPAELDHAALTVCAVAIATSRDDTALRALDLVAPSPVRDALGACVRALADGPLVDVAGALLESIAYDWESQTVREALALRAARACVANGTPTALALAVALLQRGAPEHEALARRIQLSAAWRRTFAAEDEARRAVDRALARWLTRRVRAGADDVDTLSALAARRWGASEDPAALELARAVLARAPADVRALQTAWALRAQGNNDEAAAIDARIHALMRPRPSPEGEDDEALDDAPDDDVAPPEPEVPDGFVLRARYDTPDGTFSAGTAFALRLDDGAVVAVTALHVFGPAGGLDADVAPSALPAFVRAASLVDAFTGAAIARAGPALALPAADPERPEADLAVLPLVDPAAARPRPLAGAPPRWGDRVFLAAALHGDDGDGPRLHPATVTRADAGTFEFEYLGAPSPLRATSGAPVLDARGDVVGVHVRFRRGYDRTTSTALSADALRALLSPPPEEPMPRRLRLTMSLHVKTIATLTERQSSLLAALDADTGELATHVGAGPLRVTLDYPLREAVEVRVEPDAGGGLTVGRVLWELARAYARIYDDPAAHGVWGHELGDLYFEWIDVDGDRVAVGVGS